MGTAASSGDGHLGLVAWPSFAGLCTCDPGRGPQAFGEPIYSTHYERAQIEWMTAPPELRGQLGDVIGRALVHVPAGVYTHVAYFNGPLGHPLTRLLGKKQLPQQMRFPGHGVIELFPISNTDLACNRRQGIDG